MVTAENKGTKDCTLKSIGMPKNWNIILGGVGFQLFCGKFCCKPDGKEMKANVASQGSLSMKIYRKEKVWIQSDLRIWQCYWSLRYLRFCACLVRCHSKCQAFERSLTDVHHCDSEGRRHQVAEAVVSHYLITDGLCDVQDAAEEDK